MYHERLQELFHPMATTGLIGHGNIFAEAITFRFQMISKIVKAVFWKMVKYHC